MLMSVGFFTIIWPLLQLVALVLGIYALFLLIQALKIYIRNNG